MSVVMQNNTNESPTPVAKDPAQVWWTDAAPKAELSKYVPPLPTAVEEPWRWRYSMWVGIMYGPIPIGLIIGLPLLLMLTVK
jgi:hypothetical protein